jgi:hypothetical protein
MSTPDEEPTRTEQAHQPPTVAQRLGEPSLSDELLAHSFTRSPTPL